MSSLSGAYLGGIRQTSHQWVGPMALLVRFETIHATCVHHVYVGKQLAGRAPVGSKGCTIHLRESDWPQEITVVAQEVEFADRDVGDYLPPRPWNSVRITLTASGASWVDAKFIQALAAEVPGDPVDDEFEVARTVWQGDGDYTLTTIPLPQSGFRAIEVSGVDDSLPAGNVGGTTSVVVRTVSRPPDLVEVGDGERFSVEVAGGIATVDCEVGA